MCVCVDGYLTLELGSVFAADLVNTQTDRQTDIQYAYSLERCVVSDLDMIAALLNRSFHLDERACNETGKQRDMFLSLCTIYNK